MRIIDLGVGSRSIHERVGEVVTLVAFLWVDIEEEGLVARGDTGEKKKERKRSRKSTGGKEDFIFGGWLEVRSFSIPSPPPSPPPFPSPSLPPLSPLSSSTLLAVRSSVPPPRIRSKGHRIRAIG